MAWKCSGNTNIELIDNLVNASIISNKRVITAMRSIDRKDYCPRFSYEDSPQTLGYGATISAPHMHGYALENLEPFLRPGMKALDVGSGSGYLSACMAEMVGETGKIVGIDHVKELVHSSIRNVEKSHREWIQREQIKIVLGDGRLGYEQEGPYDCIHVGAAAPTTPTELLNQLKSPGRLFIPVGTDSQMILVYDKDKDGHLHKKELMGVMYIPLTSVENQKSFYG
ncbi:protein-L-isoaspartate O-methyltransferase [Helicostylum pulchrum]|nr:protein-L-isoaspartate O-methyltransferase [Helicostylum pulchrum]